MTLRRSSDCSREAAAKLWMQLLGHGELLQKEVFVRGILTEKGLAVYTNMFTVQMS